MRGSFELPNSYHVLKQILLYTAIAGILGLLSYWVYQLLQSESENIDAIGLLPDGLETVIALERLSMWPAQGEWAKGQMQTQTGATLAIWQQWTGYTEKLYSLAESDQRWKDALMESNMVYGGTHTLSAEPWIFAFVVDGQTIGPEDWLSALTSSPINKRSYKGQTIYAAGEWYVSKLGPGLVTSASVASIEGCILAQENKKTLIHNTPFMHAYEVRSDDSPTHFFARFNAEEWMQLEPVQGEEGPAWMGVQIPADSSAQTTLVHGPAPDHLIVPAWLPQRTYYWDAIHFAQRDELLQACEAFFATSERSAFWQAAWQAYGDSCACDLNEGLISWRNGEAGVVAWDINDSVSGEVYYYGIQDTIQAVKRMPSSLLRKLDVSAPIYQIQIPFLFDRNRISSIHVEPTYLMQLGSYLLMGQSLEDLQHLHSMAGTTTPPQLLQRRSTALQNASRATYVGATSSISTLPTAFHTMLMHGEDHLIVFDKAATNSTLVSVYTQQRLRDAAPSAPSQAAPQDSLSAAQSTRKWTVINHNTSEKETLEELADHSLQLKDHGGKVLWSYKKTAPVLGDVAQIDALKNGKLQYAFTTSEGLYVIDRNGQNYAPLCRSASVQITSPLAVFDYESNKNYRLVYALENGAVENLTASGQPTEGWRYEKQGIVRHMLHFKQGTEDCLLMIDTEGQMHLHKRNGTLRSEACSRASHLPVHAPEIMVGKELQQTNLRWLDGAGQMQEQRIITE
jgi:hypothetical protein